MAVTKCLQTKENIIRMAEAAFPEKGTPQIEELTEGMCNVAYKLTYEDGFRTILKIASPIKEGFMTNECHLMDAEVKAIKLVGKHTDIKVPEVYTYDTTKSLCQGDYFFMECMEGENWITVYDSLGEEVLAGLRKEVGQVQKKLSLVSGEKFGMLGDTEHTFDTLYEFVYYLINNVLQDAERKNVEIGISREVMLERLAKDREYFDTVQTPALVHWDMWEGNIFIKDGAITGIIDWERAMWGEAFMDEPFRHHKRNPQLLEGFGVGELSKEVLGRIFWYDVLLYLTMMTEGFYREYEDDGLYHWSKGLLEEVWKENV